MATLFKTKVVTNLGTSPTDVLQTSTNNRFTLVGCNLANTTTDTVSIDIQVYDATSTVGYYIKNLLIPAYTSAKVITNGEKLVLAENCGVRITCDTDTAIDAVISYVEIV